MNRCARSSVADAVSDHPARRGAPELDDHRGDRSIAGATWNNATDERQRAAVFQSRGEPGGTGLCPAVQFGDLSGTVCTFRTGQHESDSFSWSFTDTGFSIRGDAIPSEALVALGLGDSRARSIDGTWSLQGQDVALQVTSVDGVATDKPSRTIPMMRTGPKILRLVIAGEQLVFHD